MKRLVSCYSQSHCVMGIKSSVFVLLLVCISPFTSQAQEKILSSMPKTPTSSSTVPTDTRYRIGPGDILDIRIFNRPQLSRESVRVDNRGMIRMPLLEEEIQAACRTEIELAREIATRYLKYQKNPQVDIFVKEYHSQPVAIIGAVNQPGRFQLQRRVRLLELLTFAGGPAERAGRNIQVVHSAGVSICQASSHTSEDNMIEMVSYQLNDTLRGDERSNPYVQPGDVITLPDAEQIYVVGNVLKPSAIPLKEPITISRALAMAGGLMPDTNGGKIRIIRQEAGGTNKQEIYVDIKAIEKRKAEDIVLQANDIIDVPTSGGKRFLRSLISSFAPAVSQMPVQVVH
jgi:polysaccharide biosynthesis/export protein